MCHLMYITEIKINFVYVLLLIYILWAMVALLASWMITGQKLWEFFLSIPYSEQLWAPTLPHI
jgi:hypothetical protein